MLVTTQIPCGNGRVLRATDELIEVELIAYSKGSRYTSFRISDVRESRRQQVILRPDRHFRIPGFSYKFHSQVWVRCRREGEWHVVSEEIEKLPEMVRFTLDLEAGEEYDVSTEPFREYCETTRELSEIARENPQFAQIHCIGHSIEHRPLIVLRVTEDVQGELPGQERKPVVHIVCGEHATEFAGEEIGRGMLQLVTGDSLEARKWRQGFVFDFILNANPDGNYHGWHQYNASDWLGHNYRDEVDRSWHHEFAPYLRGDSGSYSPETVALMEWMLLTRPGLYLSMHSWEGHEGCAGAYYTATELLSTDMGRRVCAVNENAMCAAAEVGEGFITTSSRQRDMHLGELLMMEDIALCYLPEGHYNWGREKLQSFGSRFLQAILNDERVCLQRYDATVWDRLKLQLI